MLGLDIHPDNPGPQPSQGPESNHRVKGEIDRVDAEGTSGLLRDTHLGLRPGCLSSVSQLKNYCATAGTAATQAQS
jgi:hypothetical protein